MDIDNKLIREDIDRCRRDFVKDKDVIDKDGRTLVRVDKVCDI